MLAVHWSPVKNTKKILRNGIKKSKSGLYCFPLTGDYQLDRWWANFFRQVRPRTQYNGFIFRIIEDDFPAAFSHWVIGSDKSIENLQQLTQKYRNSILWRIADEYLGYVHQFSEDGMISTAQRLITKNPEIYSRVLISDPDFLGFIFEDYQIVLSNSIKASRIIKVVSGSHQSGRLRYRTSKNKYLDD